MDSYLRWHNNLMPKMKFNYFLYTIRKLGFKNELKVSLNRLTWRELGKYTKED